MKGTTMRHTTLRTTFLFSTGLAMSCTSAVGRSAHESKQNATAPVTVAQEQVTSPSASRIPAGWRDLRWGMSQQEVTKLILGYRSPANRSQPWEKINRTAFPLFNPPDRLVNLALDDERFAHWETRALDDGANVVEAWFDHDQLIAVRAESNVQLVAFIRRASEDYGAAPTTASMTFVEPPSSYTKKVSMWQGNATTALVYEGSRPCGTDGQFRLCAWPTVLVVSDRATKLIGAMLAKVQDDSNRDAEAVKTAKEKATRF
jgi:hypothetical protein